MAEPKPSARRSLTPTDSCDTPTDAYGLVVRGIEAVESSKAAVNALEKSIDNLAARADKTDDVLLRLAQAEEERVKLLRESSARVDAWAERIWSLPAVQYIIMAIFVALSQYLGVSWLAENYIKSSGVVHEQAK